MVSVKYHGGRVMGAMTHSVVLGCMTCVMSFPCPTLPALPNYRLTNTFPAATALLQGVSQRS